MTTVREMLDALVATEASAQASMTALAAAMQLGVDRRVDHAQYDMVRAAVFNAQVEAYGVVLPLVVAANRVLGLELPVPTIMPAMPYAWKRSANRLHAAQQAQGVDGLGAGPAVFVGIGVAILAVIAGIAWLLDSAVENWAKVAHAQTLTQQYQAMAQARLEAYEACLSDGRPVAECAGVVDVVVPTPDAAGTVPPPPGDDSNMFLWGMAATVALLATGGLIVWWRGRGSEAIAAVPRGIAGPDRVDSPFGPSKYFLEI